MTPLDVELQQRIDEVLHFIWDPILVAGMPAARDEYRGYSPVVFAMIKEGADETEIGTYLSNVAAEKMGLKQIPGKSAEVAAILIDWRDTLKEKYAPLADGNLYIQVAELDLRNKLSIATCMNQSPRKPR